MNLNLKKMFKEKTTRKHIVASSAICLILMGLWTLSLFRAPRLYHPPEPIKSKGISPLFTHQIAPQLHNKSQLAEPFDLIITEAGVDDLIARKFSAYQKAGIVIDAVDIAFVKGKILLMGRIKTENLNFVATVPICLNVKNNRTLEFDMGVVRAGRAPLPFAAKIFDDALADNLTAVLKEHLAGAFDTENLNGSLAVPAAYELNGKKFLIDKVSVEKAKLLIHFIPAD